MIVSSEVTKKSPAQRGFFGLFSETEGSLWHHTNIKYSCDLCARVENRLGIYGRYTGSQYDVLHDLFSVYYGYKENEFHFCRTHNENEIDGYLNGLRERGAV